MWHAGSGASVRLAGSAGLFWIGLGAWLWIGLCAGGARGEGSPAAAAPVVPAPAAAAAPAPAAPAAPALAAPAAPAALAAPAAPAAPAPAAPALAPVVAPAKQDAPATRLDAPPAARRNTPPAAAATDAPAGGAASSALGAPAGSGPSPPAGAAGAPGSPAAAAATVPPPQRAIPPRAAKTAGKLEVRAQYEERLVQQGLTRLGLEVDPDPEGKPIHEIYIDAREVVLPGDFPLSGRIPWPILNYLHMRTREPILRQELLLHPGEPFRRDVFEESGRNLRSLFILSIARLVAVRRPGKPGQPGTPPGQTSVLLVTKDQWSLRLNTAFTLDQARFDALSFSLAEHNLLGRNKRLSFDFALDPGRYSLGGSYTDPRIWGSRIFANLSGRFYLNRGSNDLEGGYASVSVGRKLFSLRTQLGWQADFVYQQDIVRYFKGGELAQRSFQTPAGMESVPDVFNRRTLVASLQGSYSAGIVNKVNLTAGFRVQTATYELPADFPAVSAAARAAYQATLPRSESASGPFLSFTAFTARFLRIRDIETFALSEDFRLGPQLTLDIRYASHFFGFNSDFVELSGSFTNQHYARDNLLSYGASVAARVQYGVGAPFGWNSSLFNESVTLTFHEITPKMKFVRLHLSGKFQMRAHDLDNLRLTLGSDSGLRGFAPRQFQGSAVYRVNAELRTTALNLWTIHVGAVLFYDGGDAPLVLFPTEDAAGRPLASTAGYHQDAGLGLRVLLPQFNRDVLRLDLAFPFELIGGSYVPRFSAEFIQAF